MPRYIDADKAIELLRDARCKDCHSYNGIMCASCDIDTAIMYIDDLLTADVVEVVRCKECIYRTSDRMRDHDEIFCLGFGCYKNENGFCEVGEREEEIQ